MTGTGEGDAEALCEHNHCQQLSAVSPSKSNEMTGRDDGGVICCGSNRCLYCRFAHIALMESHRLAIVQVSSLSRQHEVDSSKCKEPSLIPTKFGGIKGTLRMSSYTEDVAFSAGELIFLVDALVQSICELLNSIPSAQVATFCLPDSITRVTYDKPQRQWRIAVLMSISVEYVVAILAVLACGALFVPIDPSWPVKRILLVLDESCPCLILTSQTRQNAGVVALSSCKAPVLSLGSTLLTVKARRYPLRAPTRSSCMCSCHHGDLRSACYLMYTSGSTGKPKGVLGTEEGLLQRLLWMQKNYPFHGSDVTIFKTSIAFIDHLTELLGPLLGKTLIIVPPSNSLSKNPLGLIPLLQAYNVSRFTAVPSLMRALLPSFQGPEGCTALSSLRLLVLSGEPLPIRLLESIHYVAPQATILNLYGSTEVSGDCLFFDCQLLWKEGNLFPESLSSVPIGKPIEGAFVSIMSDNSEESEEGELWVGGVLLALGYLDDPGSTCEKFVNVTNLILGITQHMFRTGDYVKTLADGNLIYLGRKDRTVKINGQRVALQEIELNMEAHSLVAHGAVLLQSMSNDEPNLVAFVESRLPCDATQELIETLETSLRNWLLECMPSEMIPKWFVFMPVLPLLDSGKVDYKALAKHGLYKYLRPEERESEISPLASHIRGVFEHVLKLKNISIHEDFFHLGGSSVLAAHVAYILGIDMPSLYRHRSAAALEAYIRLQHKETRRVMTRDLIDARQFKCLKKDLSGTDSEFFVHGLKCDFIKTSSATLENDQ